MTKRLREEVDLQMGGNDLEELRSAVENAEDQGDKLGDLADYIEE